MSFRGFNTWFATLSMALLWSFAAGAPVNAGPPVPAQIVIREFMFRPMSLTIKAGATVTWVNQDDEPHSVVSDTGLFRSGGVDSDASFTFTFDKPGTYHFTCSLHPRMVGTIVVE